MDENGCPICHGDGGPAGSLGLSEWFRCRFCGWEYTAEQSLNAAPPAPEPAMAADPDDGWAGV